MSVSVVIVFVTQECQDDKDRWVVTLCVTAKTILTILTAALFALCIVTRVFSKWNTNQLKERHQEYNQSCLLTWQLSKLFWKRMKPV